MLTAQYLDGSAESVREIYSGLQSKIMADIAKRIAGFTYIGHEAEYNNYKLKELTDSQAYIAQEMERTSKTSKKEVKALFGTTGTKSMESAIELMAAKNADKFSSDVVADFSGSMAKKLDDGVIQTLNSFRKLCRFSAADAAVKLNQYLDRRQLLAQAGIDSEDHAKESVLKDFAAEGIRCGDYGISMEAAAEHIFITALNQTIGQISLEMASILRTDLVQVSGHAEARPAHALWQYGIYNISGESGRYRKLSEATGYGTGAGLCGWNCRHTFWPYIEGVTKRLTQEDDDPAVYETEQKLRYYERQIRKWQRRADTLAAGGIDNAAELAKVAYWQVRRDEQAQELKNFEVGEDRNIACGDNMPYNGIRESISELGNILRL